MILKMRKLNLAALSYDRDGILNALQRTGAVQVKEHAEAEGTVSLPAGGEELRSYLSSLESALEILNTSFEVFAKDKKLPSVKDGFSVSYEEFAAAAGKKEEMDSLVRTINALTDQKNAYISEVLKLSRAAAAAKPYGQIKLPFSAYADTAHTKTKLGMLALPAWESVQKLLDENALAAYEAETAEDNVILAITAHRCAFSEVEELLNGAGFTACPYLGDVSGEAQLASLNEQLKTAENNWHRSEEELFELTPAIRELKIYCDYVNFELEKAETSEKLRSTEHTFFLEAFVPENMEEKVKEELEKTKFAIWYEFSDPAEDEEVPTLLKNNPVIANFETITNMYSPPSAREFDPNTVMAFFYSLFLGFIMADIGYGLMMLIGGGVLYFKSKAGGLKSLSGVFAIGGIFTILWGFMFNSLLGIQILPFTIMPDAQTQMYSLAGISLPSVLVISLLIGVVQLMVGYVCKAVQCWHKGEFWDGIFTGMVWAIFSLGVEIAMIGLVEDFNLSSFTAVGGIIAGVSIIVAVLTAGRKQKFLGKITKGFGSLYGLIGYFTDVLSYLRLYGLMLTGAVIAQVVSQYAVGFITSGPILAVLGVLLMAVGHVFNLAISLLGAYIHTARLQYVEFFGRFYEGDGVLFAPLGSKSKHSRLEIN